MSITADAHYNQVKGYSHKHITGYTANTHIATHSDNIKVLSKFYIEILFYLNSFLTTKSSQCLHFIF
jgi:hypothetical protein